MWPFFSLLSFCVSRQPPVCWCVSGISLSLSLSVSRSLKTSHPPPLYVPPLFFFSFSLFHWPRAPRGDGTLGSFDIGMLLKALQRVRTAREPRCPTDTHFMLMSCPGSSIRERGNEKGLGGGIGGLTPPSFLGSSHMFGGWRQTVVSLKASRGETRLLVTPPTKDQ